MVLVKVKEAAHAHAAETKPMYTCPMPQDSVFSDKPGDCPKCGMALVKTATVATAHEHEHTGDIYTCPMHPEVKSDKPGFCPICSDGFDNDFDDAIDDADCGCDWAAEESEFPEN